MSSQEEKINVLMSKITTLETSLMDEREKRMKYEDELKVYKNHTIPNLEKQLEDKESLIRTVFIEKVRIEKELYEKLKNVKEYLFTIYKDKSCPKHEPK